MMLFDRKLETHALAVNLATLKANLNRVKWEAYRGATTHAVRLFNGFLWRLNRPLTEVNQWFAHRAEDLRRSRKAHKEQAILNDSIDRMVAEGGPALDD